MSEIEGKHKAIVEAAIFASTEPVRAETLQQLLVDTDLDVQAIIQALQADYVDRGVALVLVASGYRFQVREAYAPLVTALYAKNPPRYTRALLETLALIAYRQPITRGEIEQIRGVAVSSGIMKTLQDRGWVKIVGHREVLGKPALLGTTSLFLDYFGLQQLSDLPPLPLPALCPPDTVESNGVVQEVTV